MHATLDPSDLQDVTARLRGKLGMLLGKLRASDALELAGFTRPSFQRKRLVVQAMTDLGWERVRTRFQGVLRHGYARGSQLEREGVIEVVRGDAVLRKEP